MHNLKQKQSIDLYIKDELLLSHYSYNATEFAM